MLEVGMSLQKKDIPSKIKDDMLDEKKTAEELQKREELNAKSKPIKKQKAESNKTLKTRLKNEQVELINKRREDKKASSDNYF
jgi:hypothetical protein